MRDFRRSHRTRRSRWRRRKQKPEGQKELEPSKKGEQDKAPTEPKTNPTNVTKNILCANPNATPRTKKGGKKPDQRKQEKRPPRPSTLDIQVYHVTYAKLRKKKKR